jgi:hypothetical protein
MSCLLDSSLMFALECVRWQAWHVQKKADGTYVPPASTTID